LISPRKTAKRIVLSPSPPRTQRKLIVFVFLSFAFFASSARAKSRFALAKENGETDSSLAKLAKDAKKTDSVCFFAVLCVLGERK
jgi:hypothetical protein